MKIIVVNLYCSDKEISECLSDTAEECFDKTATKNKTHRKFGPVARSRRIAENRCSCGNK